MRLPREPSEWISWGLWLFAIFLAGLIVFFPGLLVAMGIAAAMCFAVGGVVWWRGRKGHPRAASHYPDHQIDPSTIAGNFALVEPGLSADVDPTTPTVSNVEPFLVFANHSDRAIHWWMQAFKVLMVNPGGIGYEMRVEAPMEAPGTVAKDATAQYRPHGTMSGIPVGTWLQMRYEYEMVYGVVLGPPLIRVRRAVRVRGQVLGDAKTSLTAWVDEYASEDLIASDSGEEPKP